jgi:hypothetical protein
VGNVTRGTTNPNRMRRLDRWLTGTQAWRLRRAADPLVVDLGYGASPATAKPEAIYCRRNRSVSARATAIDRILSIFLTVG